MVSARATTLTVALGSSSHAATPPTTSARRMTTANTTTPVPGPRRGPDGAIGAVAAAERGPGRSRWAPEPGSSWPARPASASALRSAPVRSTDPPPAPATLAAAAADRAPRGSSASCCCPPSVRPARPDAASWSEPAVPAGAARLSSYSNTVANVGRPADAARDRVGASGATTAMLRPRSWASRASSRKLMRDVPRREPAGSTNAIRRSGASRSRAAADVISSSTSR